jgi:hypothetical protein
LCKFDIKNNNDSLELKKMMEKLVQLRILETLFAFELKDSPEK